MCREEWEQGGQRSLPPYQSSQKRPRRPTSARDLFSLQSNVQSSLLWSCVNLINLETIKKKLTVVLLLNNIKYFHRFNRPKSSFLCSPICLKASILSDHFHGNSSGIRKGWMFRNSCWNFMEDMNWGLLHYLHVTMEMHIYKLHRI